MGKRLRSLTAALAVALLAGLVGTAFAHQPHDTSGDPDDGHVTVRYSGTGSERSWSLSTLDDHDVVRVQLTAATGKSSIRVRIVDPDGREVADMRGNGELDVDTEPLRLVNRAPGPHEARRGVWRIEVTTGSGKGTYSLRWWGLAPPASPPGDDD